MTEEEIECAAQTAARRGDRVRAIAEAGRAAFWPNWSLRSVHQRVDQQLDPHNGGTPLQARLWFLILRETGDDEMLAQAVAAHAEGRARKAERDHAIAVSELEASRRRMRTVRSSREIRRAEVA